MERSKIQKAAELDGRMRVLEHKMRLFEEGNSSDCVCALMMLLSPAAYTASKGAVLHQARKDLDGLAAEIAEL